MQVPEEELVVPSNLERYGLSEAGAGIANYQQQSASDFALRITLHAFGERL